MASWIIFSLYYCDTIYGAIKPTLARIIRGNADKDIIIAELLTYKGIFFNYILLYCLFKD